MRTPDQIAITEKINEARAKQRKFQVWEQQRSVEIKHLQIMQRFLDADILVLERQLTEEKAGAAR